MINASYPVAFKIPLQRGGLRYVRMFYLSVGIMKDWKNQTYGELDLF